MRSLYHELLLDFIAGNCPGDGTIFSLVRKIIYTRNISRTFSVTVQSNQVK